MPTETAFKVDRDKLESRMSRVFKATPERLWEAHTTAEQFAQFFGPAKYEVVIDKFDVRVGGQWRVLHKDPQTGEEYAFHGEYKKLDEPKSITWTFVYEGIPDADSHVITETLNFIKVDDQHTRLEGVSHYLTPEDLSGMVDSGMESGATESWDRLAKLVEKN
ncbi:MAG: Activator of Hsp90 ATPase 1 family protein [Candidatus Saccharibacteria bacterium]|jgi:uncharacterized protein YndB with AHSA1/START domain|nr:Activator of Hsp90 ATPase 1 family protein [Candidatus Saccharibacteria bacterium]